MTNAEGKVKVWVASDMKEPLILRWAVSKDRAQEWAVGLSVSLSS